MAPGLTIRHAVNIRARPEKVWPAIATGKGLDAWFTQGAEVDARPGGSIRLRWKAWGGERVDAEDHGPVLAAEAPRRFVFRWHADEPSGATTVTFDLEPHGAGTLLRVTDAGYPETPRGLEMFMDCAVGWGEALTLVKFYVEHGLRY